MKKIYKAVIESQLSGDKMAVQLEIKNKQAFREEMAGAKQTIINGIVEEKEIFDYIMANNDFFIYQDKKRWNEAKKTAKLALKK